MDVKNIGRNVVIDALTLIVIAYHNCLDLLNYFDRVYINYRSAAIIQQEYLSGDYPLISDILSWFKSADNIVFEADGFVDEENQITKLFSANFTACCSIATKVNASFLCCDLVARKFQTISGFGISPDVNFISIPAACYKILAPSPERLSDVLYSLLKNSTFISFRAETILYQIRKQNYAVTQALMDPFMFCDTSCDMHSFVNVYVMAIMELCKESPSAAKSLARIVLDDASRIWKQGTYYRQMRDKYSDPESVVKAQAIEQYVWEVLNGIETAFEQMPTELSKGFKELSYVSKYISA